MKICLFIEGSYPYIPGGVSSWVNQLIREMKDFEFKIISIMPSREDKIEYKYDIPKNVSEIKTLYLNDYLYLNPYKKPKEPRFNKNKGKEIEKFFRFDKNLDWETTLLTLSNRRITGDCVQFFKSKYFWNIILGLYKDHYPKEEFNLFFWTVRSMFIPFFNVIQNELYDADIFHTLSTGYAGILSLIAKYRYKKPLILTEHGIYAREREEEIIKAKWVTGIYKKFWIDFFYFLSIGLYKNADKVISLFERNRQIQIELGSSEDKTMVIPNGVDIEKFSIKYEESSTFNIGAILRIVPIKDVKTLIRAFRLVKDKVQNSKLYIIGPYEEDIEYYRECVNMVEYMGMANDVVFTGKVDIRNYLKKIDILVLTSISEGQPLVILEGMASGIPFVATDVGACKELLEGKKGENIGKAGIMTPPVSPHETFKAIYKLYKNKRLRKQMGTNGRKRVEKYYRKELFINNYRNIYESLR